MNTETRYRFLAPDVIHEPLEDEVMQIHSYTGSGALLYEPLVQGASAVELVALLAARTDAETAVLEAAVARTLRELDEHGLIATAADALGEPEPATEGKEPFVEPKLEAFDELKDLLVADPVHDVEPTGWPNVKGPPERA
jgi:hypothetical protein